jgi:hypothetical protein
VQRCHRISFFPLSRFHLASSSRVSRRVVTKTGFRVGTAYTGHKQPETYLFVGLDESLFLVFLFSFRRLPII